MSNVDLVCLSHLRWGFVFQRPNHLMTRAARDRRVFFFEEPIYSDGPARLEMTTAAPNLVVAVPHLPHGTSDVAALTLQQTLLDELVQGHGVRDPIAWFYTPMALAFADRLASSAVVYDCMDELTGFQGAASDLGTYEKRLFERADIVFTGGHSLYEAKRHQHPRVKAFPSSVDVAHFTQARRSVHEPRDQQPIPGPRIGYFGVIDERIDRTLLAAIAEASPSWHLVMVGPVVKIDPADLPHRPNIHYLGRKSYDELPAYIAGWDVAIMPFALNEATRYISPTKTLEYLAAGKPVVSTAIHDVVEPYGQQGLVRVGDGSTFTREIAEALAENPTGRRERADAYLAQTSWDLTWEQMRSAMKETLEHRARRAEVAADTPWQSRPASIDALDEPACSTI